MQWTARRRKNKRNDRTGGALTSRSRTEETAVNFKLMNSQQSRAAGKRDYIETNEDVKKRLFTLHIFTVLASPETDQNEAFLYL